MDGVDVVLDVVVNVVVDSLLVALVDGVVSLRVLVESQYFDSISIFIATLDVC